MTQPTSATDLENILGPSPVPSAPPPTDAFGAFGSQTIQPVSLGVYREISLYVQRRIRVDVGHVFGVKTNPYLKSNTHLRSFINLL